MKWLKKNWWKILCVAAGIAIGIAAIASAYRIGQVRSPIREVEVPVTVEVEVPVTVEVEKVVEIVVTPTPGPAGVAHAAAANPHEAAHRARVEKLDPVFRTSGFEPWLREAGFTWSSLTLRSDQVIEETWSGRQWASGIPVAVTGLDAPWPAAMTTDAAVAVGRCVEVGPNSKLCTDVRGFTGHATLWVDAQNWDQLAPTEPADCPSTPADLERWGVVIQWLKDGSGKIAGAQLDNLTAEKISQLEACGCVVQGTNPTVRSVWLW